FLSYLCLDETTEPTHRDFITRSLENWFNKYKLKLNLSNEKLVEGIDYKLTLTFNNISEEACISCGCSHLKLSKCIMMKNKKQSNTNDDDNELVEQNTPQCDVTAPSTSSSNVDNVNIQLSHTSKKRKQPSTWTNFSPKVRTSS
ncbi:unnamed protein product, partial [Rotaria sp. Silwood2]